MRLSRPRLLLRVALLVVGGLFMLWRAAQARRSAAPLSPGEALLGSRLALVWALMGGLALLTAAAAALSLRAPRRRRSLRLGDPDPDRERPGGPRSS